MATGNFYQSGNGGLNIIMTDYDEAVEDTALNIVNDLNAKGFSIDDVKWEDTPRSFYTGQQYAVYDKDAKVVALLEFCAGYYDHANINIYTGINLLDITGERSEMTYNKKTIKRVVDVVKSHTTQYTRIATFNNGEAYYQKVGE